MKVMVLSVKGIKESFRDLKNLPQHSAIYYSICPTWRGNH